MNKLKNIGISALAGTLVSLSAAQAGGVTINGAWELSYTDKNNSSVTGNKFGMKKNLSFGGSGDLSDGGGVTWAYSVGGSDAMGLSSASMNINMGGIATLAYDSGTGGYGANAVDNIVPTAWEEIDYGLSTGITDLGAVSASKGVINFAIKAPTAGTGISLSYTNAVGASHQADGVTGEGSAGGTNNGVTGIDAVIDFVNYDAAHFGMRFGFAAQVELHDETCAKKLKGNNESVVSCMGDMKKDHPYGGTSYLTLKLGPLSLGTQATFKDPMETASTGIKNKRSVVAGAALSFGDTMSVSYGEGWDRYRYNDACRGGESVPLYGEAGNETCGGSDLDGSGGEYTTTKFSGWSAAVNFGPVALKGTRNRVGGWGENGANTGEGLDKHHSEINLSIAF